MNSCLVKVQGLRVFDILWGVEMCVRAGRWM